MSIANVRFRSVWMTTWRAVAYGALDAIDLLRLHSNGIVNYKESAMQFRHGGMT